MSYVHPAWTEHQRQRWLRPDWHRFVKPEAPRRKPYAERLSEQRRDEEGNALAADQVAFDWRCHVFRCQFKRPGLHRWRSNEAVAWRSKLIARYPDELSPGNIGKKPNDALFHAETTLLLPAAKDNGGALTNREINVSVDRDMCTSCETVLPLLGLELGNPSVTFTNLRDRTAQTMKNGVWLSRGKR